MAVLDTVAVAMTHLADELREGLLSRSAPGYR